MNTKPFFTILVPTYNHAKFVGAALDSLRAQTDPDWEAAVVNDGSTDNTAEVLNAYARRDHRIRVVHKPNGGTGSALNRALAEARGDWICWLSSDDFFDPKKLAIHRDWIRRDPSCRFYFTYFRLFNEAAQTTVDHQLWGPLPEREFQTLGLFYRNFISGISICIHRESWQAIGNFNERLRYAQDYDMWLRLLSRYPGTFIPEWTCISRQHAGQGSEVFQQACYFDTAAAGVQFLIDHPFEDLFPLLDLNDAKTALNAVERALTQAADDNAFLYWYGAHPNLLARALHWAWDETLGSAVHQRRAEARTLARQMTADFARQLRGTPLGWHWQFAAAACRLPRPDFSRMLMTPLEVGTGFVHDRRASGQTDLRDLERYFKMQYGRTLPPAPAKSARRTVVICDSQGASTPATRMDLAHRLRAAGCQTAIVASVPGGIHCNDGIPCIAADSSQILEDVLPALLPVDAMIWQQAPPDLGRFPAKRHLDMHDDDPVEQIVIDQAVQPRRALMPRSEFDARRKVVFISSSPWGGGAERVTHTLLHRLNPAKYELHFVYLTKNPGPQPDFDPSIGVHSIEQELQQWNLRPRGPLFNRVVLRVAKVMRSIGNRLTRLARPRGEIHLHHFLRESTERIWPQVVALADVLRRIGPDALLIPFMEEAAVRVWRAQALVDQTYCVSLHTAESYALPLMFRGPDQLIVEKFLLSSACRSAAAITIPSTGCKDDLAEHLHVSRQLIEVVPNPIEVDAVLQSTCDPPETRLPPLHGKSLFVHAARLSIEKNHALMLDACRLLKDRYPRFLVACLGDGPCRPEIAKRIVDLGLQEHVVLLGAVKNPFPYMARAQGLLLTSDFESFGMVLVEALACGAAPITVDCPFGPRGVLDDGAFGLLVPPKNAAALAEAMHRVATDGELREQMRMRGQERAAAFDADRIAARWESIIDRLTQADESRVSAPRLVA